MGGSAVPRGSRPGADRVADRRLDLTVQRNAGIARELRPARRPRAADWSCSKSTGSDLIPSTNSWQPRSPCARSSTRPTSPSTASSRGRTCGRRSAVPATSAPAQIQTDLLLSCDAVLMGRHTYDGFAPVWPTRSGDPVSDQHQRDAEVRRLDDAEGPGVEQHPRHRRRRRRRDHAAQAGARQGHRPVRLRRRVASAARARPARRAAALGAPADRREPAARATCCSAPPPRSASS